MNSVLDEVYIEPRRLHNVDIPDADRAWCQWNAKLPEAVIDDETAHLIQKTVGKKRLRESWQKWHAARSNDLKELQELADKFIIDTGESFQILLQQRNKLLEEKPNNDSRRVDPPSVKNKKIEKLEELRDSLLDENKKLRRKVLNIQSSNASLQRKVKELQGSPESGRK